MKILLESLVAILIASRVCTGQSQSAVRVPSAYRNGVKWVLATNYEPLTLLETAATPEEEGVVYILPAAERGIQNYALHAYANGHSAPVTARPTGIAFSTTELPPTFVSPHIAVAENNLRAASIATHEYPVQPTQLPPSFVSHVTPLPTGIRSSVSADYQKVQQPLTTYNIAHDYLTSLLSRSAVPPKPDAVAETYTPQLTAKSQIVSGYTPQLSEKSQIVSTYTPQVEAKLGNVVSTYTSQVTAKPFGSSFVSGTYRPETHLDFAGKYAPVLSPSVYSALNDKSSLINSFGNGLSLKSYQQLKPVVSSTTFKPEFAENDISSKDEQISEDVLENGYKYDESVAK